MTFVEKTVETKKKEKSVKNKVPSKKKPKTPSASKKLSEEAAVNKNVCNSIENQENRVNCANSKNYNTDNTSNVDETGSKETDRSCQNGTDSFRIIIVLSTYNMLHKISIVSISNKQLINFISLFRFY